MRKESKMPYVSGEPEGLGRQEGEEFKEEEERLEGGERQLQIRRKKRAIEKAEDRPIRFVGKAARALKKEISLKDARESDLSSDELDPEQAFELNQAIKHGFADIAQNLKEEIEPERPKTLEELRKATEGKEERLRQERRRKK